LVNWEEYNYNPLYMKMQYSQSVEALYGRLANALTCSIGFNKRRCCPTEHSWKNVPIWVRLYNVAVYETWLVSSKLMKRPGSTTYMLHLRSKAIGSQVLVWLWTKLIRTKLTIQGIIHCSSCGWVYLEVLGGCSTSQSLPKHWDIKQ
jgi:hypothetical protein